MPAIVSLGDVDIDLLVSVDRYPFPGEESFAKSTTMGLGGSASNTAVVLARLGFDVAVMAQIGDDEFGASAKRLLVEAGVDTTLIVTTEADITGMNVVMVDPDGERTMIGLRGANRSHPGSPGWESGCRWLHLSAYALLQEPQRSAAVAALDLARARSIPVSVDVPSGVAAVLGEELLPYLRGRSVVALGEASLEKLGRDGFDELDIGILAVTDGNAPFSLHRENQAITLSPPRVDVVDGTGAGDSFVAGLIAGQLWEAELGTIAVLAASLGAAATGKVGAGTALGDRDAVMTLLTEAQWPGADPTWVREARRLMIS